MRNGWHIELDGSSDEDGGWSRGIDLNFSYRPGDQWDVSLDPSYERSEQSRQYVTAISGGRAETFRTRYVFAHVVLRWEWRPGSTMFVVWQQDRNADRDLRLVRPGDLFDAFSATGDNFLAVKVSYWIPVR